MVEALIALVATLAGFAASGLVLTHVFGERSQKRRKAKRAAHLIAWTVTVLSLTIAFVAMTAGGLLGYSASLFRIAELGAALLAPLSLAIGVILLISRPIQVRFMALLVSISFTIVAASVLLLDPTQNAFDKSFPKPGAHYHYVFAGMVVAATQVLVVITLLACAAVTAFRVKNQDRAAYAYMQPMALVVLAGVLLVAGSGGYLPGPLAALLLAAALGLVAYGALKTADSTPEPQDRTARASNRMAGAQNRTARPPNRTTGTADPRRRTRQSQVGHPTAAAMPSPAPVPNGAGGPYYGDQESGGPDGGRPGLGERMYGQITVFTLVDGRTEVFDQLAAAVVQAARTNEPDLLVFSTHDVAGAPNQRIFYQLFRDRAAYEQHQRLPHVRQFLGQSRAFVSATNVIELALNSAKVVPLPSLGGNHNQPQRGYQG